MRARRGHAALLALALVPLSWLIWGAAQGALGPEPVETISRTTGAWALNFLLASLAVTPLRRLPGLAGLAPLRRTLGLLALQVLRAAGARVLVVSRSRRRFDLARALGADVTHAVVEGDLEAVARTFSGREGVATVVETAGTAEAVSHALGEWKLPGQASQNDIIEALNKLTAQVQALAVKVDELEQTVKKA